MSAYSCRRLPGLLLIAALPCWTAPALAAAATDPAGRSGGYLVFSDFTVDAEKHVISPPATARAGDLLQIRPLRLNDDEYLILQKCTSADCTKAEVVRAWNSGGYMGPYPVLSDKIPIKAGAKYMLWMQRVPTRGVENFSLYQRDSPPLVFTPAGS
ncbi:MAG: hypothetical protein ACRETG_09570, partial [Steroidobacteraceae bacterium]